MIELNEGARLYVCLESVDMRKSINGLTAVIVEQYSAKPQTGDLFLFCNKRRDKAKGLFWHRNGFFLIYKRLEKGKFKLPKPDVHNQLSITKQQLSWLLAGLDFNLIQAFNSLDYTDFY